MCIYIHVYIYMCVCVCIFMCICMCVYVCVYVCVGADAVLAVANISFHVITHLILLHSVYPTF